MFYLLTSENSRPNFSNRIPGYIIVGEGNEVSSFEFMVFETPENDFKEIEHLREWVACSFLDYIFDELMRIVQTRAEKLTVDDAVSNCASAIELLIKIKKERDVRRKRCTWGKSKLIKHQAELRQLMASGASYADMQFWLRKEKRIKVSRSTVKRFLDKHPSAIHLGS